MRCERLFEAKAVSTAALLTAWNPLSVPLSDQVNDAAQARLIREVEIHHGPLQMMASGVHPSGKWPAEKSVLILRLDYVLARNLAQKYRQNGFVWIEEDAVPQLVLLR